jgi:sugar phosphate isomerase/epimerase
MTDIVDRLRNVAVLEWCEPMCAEAADEIERLRHDLTPAEVSALTQERDDLKSDYLRRHREACDRADRIRELEAEIAAFPAQVEAARREEREAWAKIIAELAAEAATEGAVIAPDGLLALVAAMSARGDA